MKHRTAVWIALAFLSLSLLACKMVYNDGQENLELCELAPVGLIGLAGIVSRKKLH